MTEIASAFVSILPSARGFGPQLNSQISGDVNSSGKRMGASFGRLFAAGAGIVAAAGIGNFLKGSIDEAREAQKVGALTENVIRSTGGAANVTAKQVEALASSFSNVTGIDDETIQSGANLLLTFKNVRNEAGLANNVFDRATRAAVDLSAAGFGSVESASKQLGKALNDPLKGISALSRSGVTFTEGQKKQIEGFVASNDLLSAQKVILGEVNGQVGGAAAATATYGEKAAVAFGNIKEQIGTALLPVIDAVAKKFLELVPAITKVIDGIGPAFQKVRAYIAPLIDVVGKAAGSFGPLKDVLAGLGGGVLSAVIGAIGVGLVGAIGSLIGVLASPVVLIGALVGALVFAYSRFDGFRAVVDQVVNTVRANFLPVLTALATTFTTTILPAITSLVTYLIGKLGPVFTQVFGIITTQVIPVLTDLATFFFQQIIPAVVAIVTSVATKLKPVFEQLVATFQTQVLPTLQKLIAKFKENLPAIKTVVLFVLQFVGALFKVAAAILGKVLPPLIRFAGFMFKTVVPAVSAVIFTVIRAIATVINFGKAVVNAVQAVGRFVSGAVAKFNAFKTAAGAAFNAAKRIIADAINAAARVVSTKLAEIIGFFKALPGRIISAIGDLGNQLFDWAKGAAGRLISGLVGGITSKIDDVKGAVKTVTSVIGGFLPGSPIKEGPLKSWNRGGAGKRLMGFLIEGIQADGPKVVDQVAKVAEKIKKLLEYKKITAGMAQQMQQVVKTIGKQAQAIAATVAAKVDLKKSLTDSFRGEFSLTDLIQPNEFGFSSTNFDTVKTGISSFVTRVKAFAGKLQKMHRAGLPPALISEVAGLGSADGSRVADLLLSGGSSGAAYLRSAYGSIDAASTYAATVASDARYNNQIRAQQQTLNRSLNKASGRRSQGDIDDLVLSAVGRIRVENHNTVGLTRRDRATVYLDGKNEAGRRG